MREDAQHFWSRSRECRVVGENTRDPEARKLLFELAQELEDEATKIEEEAPESSVGEGHIG